MYGGRESILDKSTCIRGRKIILERVYVLEGERIFWRVYVLEGERVFWREHMYWGREIILESTFIGGRDSIFEEITCIGGRESILEESTCIGGRERRYVRYVKVLEVCRPLHQWLGHSHRRPPSTHWPGHALPYRAGPLGLQVQ